MIGSVLVANVQCFACGGTSLEPHRRVAGDPGPAGLIPTTDRFGTALADLVRCADCGHMQLDRLPPNAELTEAYRDAASDDYLVEEAGQRRTARWILDQVERHTDRGSILDLGCWVGFLLDEARGRGWRATGVEPSAFASGYARQRFGLEVHTADLMEAELPGRSFDAVFMGDVIEHLPDPGAALDHVATLLEPRGVLALALPDAGSRLARLMGRHWWSVIPTHVQYFTRRSMALLLVRHGYAVVSMDTAPKAFTVRYYLERIGGYDRQLAAGLVRAAGWARVLDRVWAPDFRDRMLVLAQRRVQSVP
jgi:SAM-dependent methyltransferase